MDVNNSISVSNTASNRAIPKTHTKICEKVQDVTQDQKRQLLNEMKYAKNRLETFKRNDWPKPDVCILKLAEAGFYYLPNGADRVLCPFCDICLEGWSSTHEPIREHYRQNYRCRFIAGYDVGNIPVYDDPVRGRIRLLDFDVAGPYGSVDDEKIGSKFSNEVESRRNDHEITLVSSSSGMAAPITKSSSAYGGYHEDDLSSNQFSTLIFSFNGSLNDALKIFTDNRISVMSAEMRSSTRLHEGYEFIIRVDTSSGDMDTAYENIKNMAAYLFLLSHDVWRSRGGIPWFPCKRQDLDIFVNQLIFDGSNLPKDHPGHSDDAYLVRRKYFADLASNYKHGMPIPRIKYTGQEIKVWETLFHKLSTWYANHACRVYNHVFTLMVANCGYRGENIPQLEDVSRFLGNTTGFILRPITGLLSSRDFLSGLALRVFHSAQHMRHHSKPLLSQEPDVCQHLLGHIPLLADTNFARFVQAIGLASLGAPEVVIEELFRIYWFTAEYGLYNQRGQVKVYGARLLSNCMEIASAVGDKMEIKHFDPRLAASTKFSTDEHQSTYFIIDSFEDALNKFRQFAQTIPRPFDVRYEPFTHTVDIIVDKSS